MKNYKSFTQKTVVDKTTGEIIEVETMKNFKIQTTVDKFYMTFIDFAAPIFELKQGVDKSVIAKMCCMAEFNTGIVKLTASDRTDICESLNISKQQLTNSIARLKKLSLINGSAGRFIINPQIFWKGDLNSRDIALKNEDIKLVFNFTAEQ